MLITGTILWQQKKIEHKFSNNKFRKQTEEKFGQINNKKTEKQMFSSFSLVVVKK